MSTLKPTYSFLFSAFLEVILVGIGWGAYTLFPFFRFYFSGMSEFGFTAADQLKAYGIHKLTLHLLIYGVHYMVTGYLIILPIVLYIKLRSGSIMRSSMLYFKLLNNERDKEFWNILRVYGLKFLFIPLMVLGAVFYSDMTYSVIEELGRINTIEWKWFDWVNKFVYELYVYFSMTMILFIYSFGYLVESKKLGNEIVSIDNNPFSWLVTIICYAPFFAIISYFIPLGAQDFAFFKNHEITAIVRLVLISVITVKSWSIIVLGSRSSNLTNRGIIQKGPYKWVRHPHYLTKIFVWWICLIPSMIENYWLFGGMVFWTTIYVFRALMEEEHLKKDEEYRTYCEKVKWRFVPGLY